MLGNKIDEISPCMYGWSSFPGKILCQLQLLQGKEREMRGFVNVKKQQMDMQWTGEASVPIIPGSLRIFSVIYDHCRLHFCRRRHLYYPPPSPEAADLVTHFESSLSLSLSSSVIISVSVLETRDVASALSDRTN